MGLTSKEIVVVVAAAAICAKTVAAIVVLRCFVETFEPLDDLVSPSVAGFVATPAMGIVVTVSVAAAFARDSLVGLSVAETVSLVVRMSVGMYSYRLIEYFAGVGYFLGVIVVAEADHRLPVAVQIDLKSG